MSWKRELLRIFISVLVAVAVINIAQTTRDDFTGGWWGGVIACCLWDIISELFKKKR